jgi:hypothetical protein
MISEVMLIVTIITGRDKPNVVHKEPMPSIEVCLQEAGRFMTHDFPEFVDAQAVSAQCIGKRVKDDPS